MTPARDASTGRSGVSVRVRIITSMLLVVVFALTAAGAVVYAVERERVEDQMAATVDQELAELQQLRTAGVDPATGQPFASAEEVVTTFLSRNVPGRGEVLLGWWEGRAQNTSPGLSEFGIDLAPGGEGQREIGPLADAGRSGRVELSEVGEVLVTVQPLSVGGESASLVVLTSTSHAFSGLRATMRTYAMVSLVAVAVLGLGVAWQAGRLLSPLRDLRRSAEQVTDRDLSSRLPERGNDDLTRLTRTYNGMLDRLETSFAAQRQFLDDAGHELKTPLTVLRGHLELLDPEDPDDVATTRDLLVEEVDRMSRLVEDLIMLTKARRPDFVRPASVHVGDLTRRVLAKAQGMGPRVWVLDEEADVVAVLDEQRITQAMLQLADNARKHTDPTDEIAVGSALSADGRHLMLWVRDSGDGVDSEAREAIWGRFHRSGIRPGDAGFGLGLSIVRAIVEASGGSVAVQDPPPPHPPGARFLISLPGPAPERTLQHSEDTWPRS